MRVMVHERFKNSGWWWQRGGVMPGFFAACAQTCYESLGGKVRLETGGEVSLESQVKAPEVLIGASRLK